MIVYSSNDYEFVNYKDEVKKLTTLFKIISFKISHCEVPTLSNNYVVVWNTGTVQSGGSPKPGGTIYLQNDYVAISYTDTVGFDLVYSNGYQFNEHYLQVIPTNHYCTPMARVLMQPPTNFIFIKGGCVATYSDAPINGVQADYIALDCGEPIAAFGVKQRMYPCLPFPYKLPNTSKLAFISKVNSSQEAVMYHNVGECDGLVSSPALKSYIQTVRNNMASYQDFEFDIDKASGFGLPISDALLTDGLIFSALAPVVAKQYIADKEELKNDPSTDFKGLILSSQGLLEIITSGLDSHENLYDLIKNSDKIPGSSLVLLNSEFNAILQLYNDTYRKYQKIASMAALKRMRSDATTLLDTLGKMSPNVGVDVFNRLLDLQMRPGALKNTVLNPNLKLSFLDYMAPKLSVLSWDPDNKEEEASLYTGRLQEYIDFLGNDCDLTDEEFDALATTSADDAEEAFSIPLINTEKITKSPNESVILARLRATLINSLSDAVNKLVEKSNDTISTNNCVWTTSGRYVKSPKGDVHVRMFDNQPFKLSFDSVAWTQKGLLVNYTASCHYIDMDMRKMMDTVRSKISEQVKSKLFSNATVNVWLDRSICGCSTKAGDNRREFDRAKGWDGVYVRTFIGGQFFISNPLSVLSLTTVNDSINTASLEILYPGTLTLLEKNLVRVEQIKKKVISVINIFASNIAFELVGYLFESCKDRYEFQAIGCIGTNYDGIPCIIEELAYVTSASVEYVAGILRLIDESPMDEELRAKLSVFRNQLAACHASYANIKPIYYLSKESVLQAPKSASENAFYHYLYGAI